MTALSSTCWRIKDFHGLRFTMVLTRIVLACICLDNLALSTAAANNAYGLGASYDSTKSNVIFRVYSSRATRIEVDLYASPMGSPELLRFGLKPDNKTNIFRGSILVPA